MDEIIYNSIKKYFNTLQYTGYINYDEVYKLLYLIGVKEMADTDIYGSLTEEDYKEINKSINCIYGTSCLFPYPNHCNCIE